MNSLLKFSLITLSLSYKLSLIPGFILCPAKSVKSSVVYDQENDEIMTIGGEYESSDNVPQIYILKTNLI